MPFWRMISWHFTAIEYNDPYGELSLKSFAGILGWGLGGRAYSSIRIPSVSCSGLPTAGGHASAAQIHSNTSTERNLHK